MAVNDYFGRVCQSACRQSEMTSECDGPGASPSSSIFAKYQESERQIERSHLYLLQFIGIFVVSALAVQEAIDWRLHMATPLVGFALILMVGVFVLWRFQSTKWARRITVGAVSGLLAYAVYAGTESPSILFWVYCLIPSLFVLITRRNAALLFVAFLAVTGFLFYSSTEFVQPRALPGELKSRFILSSVCLFIFLTLQERAREARHNALLEAGSLLNRLSMTDQLTGLLNRRAMQEEINREHSRFNRTGHPYSIVFLNVDHFKSINDRYGHDAGDEVLVSISACLSSNIRIHDRAARWGGEEFLLLFSDTALPNAIEVAQKLRAAIQKLCLMHEGERIVMTISAGVTQSEPNWTADKVISVADARLYEAKSSGRNKVVAQ